MTRTAGIRTHITGDVRLDGTILRWHSFALEIPVRNQCENARGCNRCDNEQPLPPKSRQLPHNFRQRHYEKRGAWANPPFKKKQIMASWAKKFFESNSDAQRIS